MAIMRRTTTPPTHATQTTAPPDPAQLELPLPAVPTRTPAAPRPDMGAAAPATARPSTPRTSAPAAPEQLELQFASRAVLLTPPQAADILGVTPRALERWRGTGEGPHYVRLSRKNLRYSIEDIEAFIGANRRASTAPGAGLANAA